MRKMVYWLSLILIFTIPFEKTLAFGDKGAPTFTKFFGLFVAAGWLAAVLVSDKIRKPRPFHIVAFLFVLWNVVTIFWSFNPDQSINRATTYFQLIGLVVVLWDLYTTPESVRAGLQAFILGGYVSVISAIWNYVKGVTAHQYINRYTATGFNENEISLILALGLPIAWYLAVFAENNWYGRRLKLINYAYVPLALFAILLTASRGGLISTFPAFLFILTTFNQLKIVPRLIIFTALIVSLFVVHSYMPESSYERLAGGTEEIAEGDLTGRVTIWEQGLDVFSQHPVLGVGTGAFQYAIALQRAGHNAYLEILVESGLVGVILFGLVIVLAIYNALLLPRWDSRLWLTLLLVWAIGVSALSLHYRKPTWLILSLPVTAANAFRMRKEASLTKWQDSARPVSISARTK